MDESEFMNGNSHILKCFSNQRALITSKFNKMTSNYEQDHFTPKDITAMSEEKVQQHYTA